MLRILEGLLRVDNPVLVAQGGEELLPSLGLGAPLTTPRQGELALAIELREPRQGQPPKTPREDADGQEEVGPTRHPLGAIWRSATRGQDTVQMRVMVELLAPRVQHGEAANLGPEMLGVPGNVLERLRHGATEQPREGAGGLQRQRPQVVWQGKDHMDVGRLQYLTLPSRKPAGLGGAVTCGTAAMATGVLRLLFVPAVVTLGHMSAQGGGPAPSDGPQGPVLRAREGRPRACEAAGAMLAYHIGHFA